MENYTGLNIRGLPKTTRRNVRSYRFIVDHCIPIVRFSKIPSNFADLLMWDQDPCTGNFCIAMSRGFPSAAMA